MSTVSEAMERTPVQVSTRTTAAEVTRLLQTTGAHRHALVFDGDNLVGVVCACDLERATGAAPVLEVMSAPAQTISVNTSPEEAVERMRMMGIGCLPVLAGGLLLGLVTRQALQPREVLPL